MNYMFVIISALNVEHLIKIVTRCREDNMPFIACFWGKEYRGKPQLHYGSKAALKSFKIYLSSSGDFSSNVKLKMMIRKKDYPLFRTAYNVDPILILS